MPMDDNLNAVLVSLHEHAVSSELEEPTCKALVSNIDEQLHHSSCRQ